MADTVSIARIIRHLEEREIKIATSVIGGGAELKDYLIGTGRYRECRSLIQLLEEQAKKPPAPERARDDDEIGDLDPDDDDEDDAPEPTPRLVRAMRTKPRGWGA